MKYLGFQFGFQDIRVFNASSICVADSDCIMNSAATQNPELVRTQIKKIGADHIVLSYIMWHPLNLLYCRTSALAAVARLLGEPTVKYFQNQMGQNLASLIANHLSPFFDKV